jgi:hypothetical protein
MIEVSDLVRKIRFKQKDLHEIKYSDYEILQAINEALSYLNQSLALGNSEYLEKDKEYVFDDDAYIKGISLPYDFMTLISVTRVRDGYKMHPVSVGRNTDYGEYKVFANKLYCREKEVKVAYRAVLTDVENINEDIALPAFMSDGLVNLSIMVMNNQSTTVLSEATEALIKNITPLRKYANARQRMPFKC